MASDGFPCPVDQPGNFSASRPDSEYDLAAIHDRGVYAICTDDGSPEAKAFVVQAERYGHRVERLPRDEAVKRHRAFLATLPEFKGLLAED